VTVGIPDSRIENVVLVSVPDISGEAGQEEQSARIIARMASTIAETRTGEADAPEIDRTAAIIAAAYALLEEEGLDGLTIRAVLARTGLSRRAVYDRFAGKDDLMVAVFEHVLGLAAIRFREQIGDTDDPLERLRIIVAGIVLGRLALPEGVVQDSNRIGAAMSREHLRLAEARPEQLQRALEPLIDLIAEQLSAGMVQGVMRTGDARRLAALVYNLVSSSVHQELLAQESGQSTLTRQTELAAEIWDFCRRAVSA
jgi:AcrR family transcriptional regulator